MTLRELIGQLYKMADDDPKMGDYEVYRASDFDPERIDPFVKLSHGAKLFTEEDTKLKLVCFF